MNKRSFFCFAALALIGALAMRPAPARANDARDLARINAYLNGISTLKGNFVQVGPDGGISEGAFYMRRPGRIRFEYAKPSPTLVVADGVWVGVIDRNLKTLDRYPLSSTPLALLLKKRVDLAQENAVRLIERDTGQIRVTAVDPADPSAGVVTMVFADNPLELRQWIVTDAQGLTTTIALRDMRSNVTLAPELFVITDPANHGGANENR